MTVDKISLENIKEEATKVTVMGLGLTWGEVHDFVLPVGPRLLLFFVFLQAYLWLFRAFIQPEAPNRRGQKICSSRQ